MGFFFGGEGGMDARTVAELMMTTVLAMPVGLMVLVVGLVAADVVGGGQPPPPQTPPHVRHQTQRTE